MKNEVEHDLRGGRQRAATHHTVSKAICTALPKTTVTNF